MKIKAFRQLLRVLLTLLGTGIGGALAAAGISLYRLSAPEREIPVSSIIMIYVALCLLFSLIFFLLSNRMTDRIMHAGAESYARIEAMPLNQFLSAILGLILGMVIGALIVSPLRFLGSSVFATVLSTIIMIALGGFGYAIGYRRGDDVLALFRTLFGFSSKSFTRHRIRRAAKKAQDSPAQPYLVDTSALIDGRIVELCEKGFLRGTLVIPSFIIDELQHMSGSSDNAKRTRAQRGLDILGALQQNPHVDIRNLTYEKDRELDVDVRLLRMSRDLRAPIITCDHGLTKAGQVSDLSVLNLHELASMMRPVVTAGDVFSVQIIKEGRERSQGIGYMDDGTMVVVEDTRNEVGNTITVEVTSALQTSAGRMIFAKPAE